MEEKSRQQMLEEILRRFCQLKILHYDVIEDLLLQLKSITKSKGNEEASLLLIVRSARKELKKYKQDVSQSDKKDRLRNVLRDTINDLTDHIRIYFSTNGTPIA